MVDPESLANVNSESYALQILIQQYGLQNYRTTVTGRQDKQHYHIFRYKKAMEGDFGLSAWGVECIERRWQIITGADHFVNFSPPGFSDLYQKISLPPEAPRLTIAQTMLHSNRQGEGLGSALVVAMQEELRLIPCLEVVSFTDDGLRVKHHYERLGFIPTTISHPEAMNIHEKRQHNWMYKIHGRT